MPAKPKVGLASRNDKNHCFMSTGLKSKSCAELDIRSRHTQHTKGKQERKVGLLCHAMSCYAMLCCAMPCCAVPCHAGKNKLNRNSKLATAGNPTTIGMGFTQYPNKAYQTAAPASTFETLQVKWAEGSLYLRDTLAPRCQRRFGGLLLPCSPQWPCIPRGSTSSCSLLLILPTAGDQLCWHGLLLLLLLLGEVGRQAGRLQRHATCARGGAVNWGSFCFTCTAPGLSWLLVTRVVSKLAWHGLTAALLGCLLLPCMKASTRGRLNRRLDTSGST
jgi:hypothetical protein